MASTKIVGDVMVDNTLKDEAIDAIANQSGYQAQISDPENPGQFIANPESKVEFVERILQEQQENFIKRAVANYRKVTAPLQTERQAVDADYTDKITFTDVTI
jgi:hypothetical protein